MSYKLVFRLCLLLSGSLYSTLGWAQAERYDFVSTYQANRSPVAESIASQESHWMKKKLKLSDKQFKQVQDVNLYYARVQEEKMAVQQRQIPNPDELQAIIAENEKLRDEKEDWYKLILTPNQWHVYQKKKKSLHQNAWAPSRQTVAKP